MDISELKSKRDELEKAVLKLIQKFEEETGCFVDDNGGILYTRRNTLEPDGNVEITVYLQT